MYKPRSHFIVITSKMCCRSQATSPVTCLTPPPEIIPVIEDDVPEVQDASNQTDTPICSEDDNTTHTISDVIGEAKPKETHDTKMEKMEKLGPLAIQVPERPETAIPQIIEISSTPSPPPPQSPTIETSVPEQPSSELALEPVRTVEETVQLDKGKPDLSGLELLSNSIVEFENHRKTVERPSSTPEHANQDNKLTIKNTIDDSLGGLGLLCALAEQRILEEVEVKQTKIQAKQTESREHFKKLKQKTKDWSREERKKERRKAKKLLAESRHKKMKAEKKCDRLASPECGANKCFTENDFLQQQMCTSEMVDKDECLCMIGKNRTYRSREAEAEVCIFS